MIPHVTSRRPHGIRASVPLMNPRMRPPRPRFGRPPRFLLFLVGLFFVVIFFRVLVSFIANWLWFQDLGFQRVFALRLLGRLLIGAAAGLFSLAFLRINLRAALRNREAGP